jgi:hypothetical protein
MVSVGIVTFPHSYFVSHIFLFLAFRNTNQRNGKEVAAGGEEPRDGV